MRQECFQQRTALIYFSRCFVVVLCASSLYLLYYFVHVHIYILQSCDSAMVDRVFVYVRLCVWGGV
jgi:hypothetical protein